MMSKIELYEALLDGIKTAIEGDSPDEIKLIMVGVTIEVYERHIKGAK